MIRDIKVQTASLRMIVIKNDDDNDDDDDDELFLWYG